MRAAVGREILALDTTPTRAENYWSVRLPVRAEQITLAKRAVMRERVVVRRQQVEERARVEARLLHEELGTSKSGSVEISEKAASESP